MICTQNNARRICSGSTVKRPRGIFCVAARLPDSVGIQAGLPIHPISRCITFFFIRDLHRLYLPRIYSRRNERLRRAPDGQTGTCERVGWDAEKGKRARDWQKYRTRNVSLTAGYSEDRGKWRAERPGSDTRRHSSEEWSSGTGGSGQLKIGGPAKYGRARKR